MCKDTFYYGKEHAAIKTNGYSGSERGVGGQKGRYAGMALTENRAGRGEGTAAAVSWRKQYRLHR